MVPLFYAVFFDKSWIKGVINKPWGPETVLGWVYILVCILWISFAVWASYNLFRKYRVSRGLERERIKFVFIGMTFMVSIISIFDGFIPLFTSSTRYFQLSPLAPLFFIGFTAYAITRYRLMDIDRKSV